VSVRSTTAAQPDFTRNQAQQFEFCHRVLKVTGLSLAIPGWEQTSIAEAFLLRTGRSTDSPWT
jgi:hypothetical protein